MSKTSSWCVDRTGLRVRRVRGRKIMQALSTNRFWPFTPYACNSIADRAKGNWQSRKYNRRMIAKRRSARKARKDKS